MAANTMRKRKIAVLGSRSVGKSSLVIQFIENHFVDAYYPTIESTFSKGVVYQGVETNTPILNSKHAIGIHGYVLVYSVTSRRSFEMVKIVYDKILDFCGKNDIPCVIVGAKVDLQSNPHSRQVQPAEGEELAKINKAAWVETSAKNNVNVGKVFELCLAEIEKRSPHGQTDQPESSRCVVM
ncbi:P-loop containing nucleoside triphosphate hydrolase protein [Chiua virens]|nr:P-loop containing nucleoside triphosphate hydrolase protein [Chiua virens]